MATTGLCSSFILAFIFAAVITAMVGYDKPVIGAVESGYPAAGSRPEKGSEIMQMKQKDPYLPVKSAFTISFILMRMWLLPC